MKSQNSKFEIRKWLVWIVLGSLSFPLVSLAGTYTADGKTVTYDGLVPCGKEVKVNGALQFVSCQLCHLFVMVAEISKFVLFSIIFPIAALLLVIGGFMFLFYTEDPKKVDQGKSILTSVVIGLVIIFAAWLIINTFFMAIGVANWTGLKEGWFQINCPIKLQ